MTDGQGAFALTAQPRSLPWIRAGQRHELQAGDEFVSINGRDSCRADRQILSYNRRVSPAHNTR
jgi:hypothetical protein